RSYVRDVPDFPTPGIDFKDVTPLLADAQAFRRATEAMAAPFVDDRVTHVVSIEARGFIFGAPVAQSLGAGFIPVRKKGKLPSATARVLVVDDVLATGGTASATAQLIERLGGEVVGLSFLIALSFLNGRQALGSHKTSALITY